MSVRERKRRDPKTGAVTKVLMIDIVFEHPDGTEERVRKVSPVQTKRGAEHYEREVRQRLLEGKRAEPTEEPVVPTLAEFVPNFMDKYARVKNKSSEVTAKDLVFRVHLIPYFGTMKLDKIRAYDIDSYIATKVKAGLKPKSVNNHLGVLGKALRQAKKWQLIIAVPDFEWLPVRDQPFDFLSFEEADKLMGAVTEEPWRTMMFVAMRTGLRPSELRALRWTDVDMATSRIVVRQGEYKGVFNTPKDGDSREVDLSDETVHALRRHRHLRGELVFCHDDGKPFTEPAMRKPLARACKKAGLRPLSWYVFRHTFASHLVMRGVPLKAVADLMGHATIEMTMRYAHLSPVARKQAVNLLDSKQSYGTLTAPKEEVNGNT
jgi:integrase